MRGTSGASSPSRAHLFRGRDVEPQFAELTYHPVYSIGVDREQFLNRVGGLALAKHRCGLPELRVSFLTYQIFETRIAAAVLLTESIALGCFFTSFARLFFFLHLLLMHLCPGFLVALDRGQQLWPVPHFVVPCRILTDVVTIAATTPLLGA